MQLHTPQPLLAIFQCSFISVYLNVDFISYISAIFSINFEWSLFFCEVETDILWHTKVQRSSSKVVLQSHTLFTLPVSCIRWLFDFYSGFHTLTLMDKSTHKPAENTHLWHPEWNARYDAGSQLVQLVHTCQRENVWVCICDSSPLGAKPEDVKTLPNTCLPSTSLS